MITLPCRYLFLFRQWLRYLTDTINEELRHWADRPALQGDDSDGSRQNRHFDRQDLDRRMLAPEAHHGRWSHCQVESDGQQRIMQLKGSTDDGATWNLQAASPEYLRNSGLGDGTPHR